MMDITTVIINYQTPDLLEAAVNSFKIVYPDIPLLIIDNGSKDDSIELIKNLSNELNKTSYLFLDKNIYHGPAMDLAAREHVNSDNIFFLDSDTETFKGGFLETMHHHLSQKNVYGAGEVITVNKRGFKSKTGYKILLTPYMLIDRNKYLMLPPFIHHGQPTINNFKAAGKDGYHLENFAISEYIHHHWRGTANRFGYGLGLRGKMDFVLNKLGL